MYDFLKLNVLNTPLEPCCWGLAAQDELTGLATNAPLVCIEISNAFLDFSLEQGMDLTTPRPEWAGKPLQTGDRWYIDAQLWLKSYEACVAPKVVLESTARKVLKHIPLSLLRQFSVSSPTPSLTAAMV